MTPVVWLAKPGVCTNCRWDEQFLMDLFEGAQKRPATLGEFDHLDSPLGLRGHVCVVLPGGNHIDDVEWVNEQIAPLDEVTLFITSDEGAEFPIHELRHDHLRLWVQTPRPEIRYPVGTQFLPIGSGGAWRHAQFVPKAHRAALVGQSNHQRRRDALSNAARVPGSFTMATAGFLKGLDREAYLDILSETWWAPAPAGVVCQESFRFWEALEMGAIPVPDALRPDGEGEGYWSLMAPGFPVPPIKDWRRLPSLIDSAEAFIPLPEQQLTVHGWWHLRRRELARTLAAQCTDEDDAPGDLTVVMPTSPISIHPDTEIIDTTIATVRANTDAEIIIMCDRPRPEMMHLEEPYIEYLRRLMSKAERDWWNVTPVVMPTFCHQVEMLRRTMPLIDSEYIMYVEHDTPLWGAIEVPHVIDTMRGNGLNLMRFYHEVAVHPEHEHLMAGPVVDDWRPTMQWSQRPHIARRSFYEKRVLRLFESTARCMIEDAMFGIVEGAWLRDRGAAWEQWRMALYHPSGDIKRSGHLDGRGSDPKFEDSFKYRWHKGVRPPGAPA